MRYRVETVDTLEDLIKHLPERDKIVSVVSFRQRSTYIATVNGTTCGYSRR